MLLIIFHLGESKQHNLQSGMGRTQAEEAALHEVRRVVHPAAYCPHGLALPQDALALQLGCSATEQYPLPKMRAKSLCRARNDHEESLRVRADAGLDGPMV